MSAKKCLLFIMSLILFTSNFIYIPPATAKTVSYNKTFFSNTAAKQQNNDDNQTNSALSIDSKTAVLIENNSGRILYEKNKDKEMIPASITKIMTLNLIFDALSAKKIKLTDEVTTSEYAASMGGSQVFLEPGETQTVETMIKCISIASANDAAVSMAEFVAGSETEFVNLMNRKAQKLGMRHTHFKNCNGLDDSISSGHYSSAYDVALMSRELITKHPEISKYSTTWMDKITHKTKKGEKEFGLTNTNKLIRTYTGITGLKTGSTSKAKYCLSATACRNGISLTAVVMASPDHQKRFNEAANLLDYGFSLCKNYSEKTSKVLPSKIKIAGGRKKHLSSYTKSDFKYILFKNESSEKISRKVYLKKNLTAPVKKGEQIGKITYFLNDTKIDDIAIYASESVNRATYPDYTLKLFKKLLFSTYAA